MFLEYAENTLQLSLSIVSLLLCLFAYINGKRRSSLYLVLFFLCTLVSNYYWTAYLFIMGDTPVVSDQMTYTGWNIAFGVLIVLLMHLKTPEERRYFHPLMLLPVPLNAVQLTLYLPFGGELNSLYQVLVSTAAVVLSLQGLCFWFFRKRQEGTRLPVLTLAALIFLICEYGMWTSSCFSEPVASLYYLFSVLSSLNYLFLVWADRRLTPEDIRSIGAEKRRPVEGFLKAIYFVVVIVCAFGGIGMAVWIRNTLSAGIRSGDESRIYDVIPVILLVFSLVIVAFAIAIVFVVHFGQKAAESSRLRQEKAIAEHASAVKSDFLANMSHEIRTPVNAILGMNEILLRQSLQSRDLPPQDQEAARGVFAEICACASNIDSAGRSLLSIVNDILDISRIEAGRLEIVDGEYCLSSVLNHVSTLTVLKAREKHLDFRTEVDNTLPDGLFGDEVRVRQILTNLLTNAVKYTDQGSIVLSVSGSGQRTKGSTLTLHFSVRDTGIGIHPEDQQKLFEKFSRLDLARNKAVEGTGLGLAITQNLLSLMGGKIAVESEYGQGSTFSVTLPQRIVSAEPVGDFREKLTRSLRSARARQGAFRAPSVHLLVVDDTPLNISVITGLLKHTEITLDTVTSGAEALSLTRSVAYDLILMDQRMPGIDGTEVLRLLRAQFPGMNRETPVICLTADAVSGAREKYLADGFTDYLSKPVDGDSLEQMLMKHLPPDRILPVPDNPADEPDAKASVAKAGRLPEDLASLRQAGIRPELGLSFCRGEENFYREILREYCREAEKKDAALLRAFGTRDWKHYRLLAHSLKSTSRQIGAEPVADLASRLESAAAGTQEDEIRLLHPSLMQQYREIIACLARVSPPAEDPAPRSSASPEGEMMEFYPEEES